MNGGHVREQEIIWVKSNYAGAWRSSWEIQIGYRSKQESVACTNVFRVKLLGTAILNLCSGSSFFATVKQTINMNISDRKLAEKARAFIVGRVKVIGLSFSLFTSKHSLPILPLWIPRGPVCQHQVWMDQDRRESQAPGDFDEGNGKISWQNLLDINPDICNYDTIEYTTRDKSGYMRPQYDMIDYTISIF